MIKKALKWAIVPVIAAVAFVTFSSFDDEGSGTRKIVLTGCYSGSTLVGYANDCDSGSSNCVDTTCN